MPNKSIIDYVNQCRTRGQSEAQIRASLIQNGWRAEDIDASLREMGNPTSASTSISASPAAPLPSTSNPPIPTIIKVLGIFGYIGGGIGILGGILFSLFAVFMGAILKSPDIADSPLSMFTAVTAGGWIYLFGPILIAYSIYLIAICRGLRKGRNWARLSIIAVLALTLISGLVENIIIKGIPDKAALTGTAIAFVIYVGLLWYFYANKAVRAAFTTPDAMKGQSNALAVSLVVLALTGGAMTLQRFMVAKAIDTAVKKLQQEGRYERLNTSTEPLPSTSPKPAVSQ